MNLIKYIFFLVVLIFTLNNCQNVKEGLGGKKKNNKDEFLVKKKNPLVLPPNFYELPKPESNTGNISNKQDEEFDIEKILGKSSGKKNIELKPETVDKSLENSILKKINKN